MLLVKAWIEQLAAPIAARAELESDGLSRALSFVLARRGIKHRRCVGSVTDTVSGDEASVWFWIEVGDLVVDYRLRDAVGDLLAPCGVFRPGRYRYVRRRELGPVTAEAVRSVLAAIPRQRPLFT